jgi:hypothetical protein
MANCLPAIQRVQTHAFHFQFAHVCAHMHELYITSFVCCSSSLSQHVWCVAQKEALSRLTQNLSNCAPHSRKLSFHLLNETNNELPATGGFVLLLFKTHRRRDYIRLKSYCAFVHSSLGTLLYHLSALLISL